LFSIPILQGFGASHFSNFRHSAYKYPLDFLILQVPLIFIILALSDFTFDFQKKFTDHHWSVKAIGEINRTALHGLLLGTNEYDPNMTYKQYKKTSKYMTALYYTDKEEKHYLYLVTRLQPRNLG
jgi:hypothetical protein